MSEPLRAAGEDAHLRAGAPDATGRADAGGFHASEAVGTSEIAARAREQAEAEDAVAAVMHREEVKATRLAAVESRRRRPRASRRAWLLAGLVLFNGYLWLGNPQWLTWKEPPAPSIDFYQNSYKISVYLQRQRIEEYRKDKKKLPEVAKQAGPPVRGVRYTPLPRNRYQLQAGRGANAVVYTSTDSMAVFMGRTLIQMGLYARGIR